MTTIDRITTGAVAQWLERPADNREVDGSIPSSFTKFRQRQSQFWCGVGVKVARQTVTLLERVRLSYVTPKLTRNS
jgi:hypothetical protein